MATEKFRDFRQIMHAVSVAIPSTMPRSPPPRLFPFHCLQISSASGALQCTVSKNPIWLSQDSSKHHAVLSLSRANHTFPMNNVYVYVFASVFVCLQLHLSCLESFSHPLWIWSIVDAFRRLWTTLWPRNIHNAEQLETAEPTCWWVATGFYPSCLFFWPTGLRECCNFSSGASSRCEMFLWKRPESQSVTRWICFNHLCHWSESFEAVPSKSARCSRNHFAIRPTDWINGRCYHRHKLSVITRNGRFLKPPGQFVQASGICSIKMLFVQCRECL